MVALRQSRHGKHSVSLSRILGLCGVIGLSTCTIVFVAADRLAQTWSAPEPAPVVAEAPPVAPAAPEPETTGTVTQGPAPPETKPRAMSGFDTERLNALMRGESLPLPAKKR